MLSVKDIAPELLDKYIAKNHPELNFLQTASWGKVHEIDGFKVSNNGKIRIKGKDGNYLAHTLNNTVVAPPRMLIAFLENNLQADGTVKIPEVLRPYMGGKELLTPTKK